jgi:DNA-binding CsgD family transcriptional regulator
MESSHSASLKERFRDGLAPTLKVNRALILATGAAGLSWSITVYYEKRLWNAFLPSGTESSAGAYAGFFVAITVTLILGAFAIRRRNCRAILSGSLAAALLLTLALWLAPRTAAFPLLAGALGIAAAMIMMGILFFVTFGFGPGSRLLPCLIIVTSSYAIEAALALGSSRIPLDAIMTLLCALLLVGLAASLGISTRFLDRLETIAARPFPFKTVGLFGAFLCLCYASIYFIHGVAGRAEEALPFLPSWLLVWIPRLAIFGAVIAARRRIDVTALGYLTVLASLLLAACGLVAGVRSPLGFALISTIDGLAEFFIDTMLLDISRKYGRSPAVLVACMATITLGTFAGEGMAGAVSSAVGSRQGSALAIFLGINCLLLVVLPILYRVLADELGGASGFSRAAAAPSPPLALAPAAIARGAARIAPADVGPIEEHFQGEYELTARELEIVGFLLERYDYRSIAGRLGISVNTLKVHVRHIYEKCDVTSRRDLIDLFRIIASQ